MRAVHPQDTDEPGVTQQRELLQVETYPVPQDLNEDVKPDWDTGSDSFAHKPLLSIILS
jgi:hypothetical protein